MSSITVISGLKRYEAGFLATAILSIVVKAVLADVKTVTISLKDLESDTGESREAIVEAVQALADRNILHFDNLFSEDTATFTVDRFVFHCKTLQKALPLDNDTSSKLDRMTTHFDSFEAYQGVVESNGKTHSLKITRTDDAEYFRERSAEGADGLLDLWRWFDETSGQQHDPETGTGTGLRVEEGGAKDKPKGKGKKTSAKEPDKGEEKPEGEDAGDKPAGDGENNVPE